jgi:hypothetical protein
LDSSVTSISNQGIASGDNFSDVSSDDPDVDGDSDPTVTLLGNTVSKDILETNQDSTEDPSVAIGEIITYQTTMGVVPGTTNLVVLNDTLAEGLAFVDCLSIEPSSADLTTDLTDGFAGACANPTVAAVPSGSAEEVDQGRSIEFDLGNLTNASASIETLTVTYRVVVLNSLSNQNADDLTNSAVWSFDGGSLSAAAEAAQVVERIWKS